MILLLLICVSKTYSQDAGSDHEKIEYILVDTGDILQIALPVAAGLYTLLDKDYEGTQQFALSYGTTLFITYTAKYISEKKRPEGRNRYDSFPSGHTSSAFSGASFIQRRYGWKYGWIAYSLAAIVGVSRMEGPDGYHDIWDVLAGAAVGTGSTYLFTTKRTEKPVNISFATGNNTYIVGVQYSF